jgi:hypothetical protein
LEDRFRADPKKMEAAVYDIRSKLNDTISILERERYKNRSLLTQMQRACNEFLDEMDDRKGQAATSERHEEFFDSVFPALERWQGVLCANSQQLCTEHGLSGQPLCDELC